MENDKFQGLVLEHLARLTQEITGIKTDVTELKTDVSGLKKDVAGLKNDVDQLKTSVIRIENDHGEKLRALFDAREVQMVVNERICDTLNRIEIKVDQTRLEVATHDALLKKVK